MIGVKVKGSRFKKVKLSKEEREKLDSLIGSDLDDTQKGSKLNKTSNGSV